MIDLSRPTPPKRSEFQWSPRKTKALIGSVLTAVVIGVGFSTFYTVQEQEHAAILTFGKFTHRVEQAGLHFKMPYPFQEVVKLPAVKTQRITIGYRDEKGTVVAVDEEALMITGDENIVSADAVVEWNISNIEQYLYNIDEPEDFLRNSAIAAIRSVMGTNKLDYAITEGKTVIQGKVKEKLIELQTLYATGIHIQDVKFQDIEPPGGEVANAFREVTNAREQKNTKINNAAKYENDRIPKARGEAEALRQNAEGEKQSRILNAQGDVAKFNAIYTEYVKNPAVTKDRLVIETLEKILPKAKIFISDSSSETVKYLPINELLRSGNSPAPSSPNSSNVEGGTK
ncbi:tail fiber protein [Paenibacillus swuensis]|uniref:Protein HflK n=1 Tax=Paenibacillus swuensis TaxID=1178515 RepID=A0A172TLJ4_9BACL|nr:FtsH protease activity modulator HflK [Paenibacillus swuensis]ANE47687.1 tail fiber protein [Paenibacillus swuensis]